VLDIKLWGQSVPRISLMALGALALSRAKLSSRRISPPVLFSYSLRRCRATAAYAARSQSGSFRLGRHSQHFVCSDDLKGAFGDRENGWLMLSVQGAGHGPGLPVDSKTRELAQDSFAYGLSPALASTRLADSAPSAGPR